MNSNEGIQAAVYTRWHQLSVPLAFALAAGSFMLVVFNRGPIVLAIVLAVLGLLVPPLVAFKGFPTRNAVKVTPDGLEFSRRGPIAFADLKLGHGRLPETDPPGPADAAGQRGGPAQPRALAARLRTGAERLATAPARRHRARASHPFLWIHRWPSGGRAHHRAWRRGGGNGAEHARTVDLAGDRGRPGRVVRFGDAGRQAGLSRCGACPCVTRPCGLNPGGVPPAASTKCCGWRRVPLLAWTTPE